MNLVVTVPKWFWPEWIAEGDAAGEPCTGEEWGFFLGGNRPPIGAGDRLYVVAHGLLRGYAPVTRLAEPDPICRQWAICRRGGGVAITIDQTIKGFRGFRKVWWPESAEIPFPDWKTKGVIL